MLAAFKGQEIKLSGRIIFCLCLVEINKKRVLFPSPIFLGCLSIINIRLGFFAKFFSSQFCFLSIWVIWYWRKQAWKRNTISYWAVVSIENRNEFMPDVGGDQLRIQVLMRNGWFLIIPELFLNSLELQFVLLILN